MMNKATLLTILVAALASGCGGGGGGDSVPSGTTPEVVRKPPINYRPTLISGLIGSYMGICDYASTGVSAPGIVTITAEGKFSVTGGPSANLLDGDILMTIYGGSRYSFLRDSSTGSTPLMLLMVNTKSEDGVPQIGIIAGSSSIEVSCNVPGTLNPGGRPGFFVAEKFLDADRKDLRCADSMGKPAVTVMGNYLNKGGEAVLGAEKFSASLNIDREIIGLAPPNVWDRSNPYAGQSFSYTLDTKEGRNLAVIYDDAGDLFQVSAQRATFAITPTTDVTKDVYACRPVTP